MKTSCKQDISPSKLLLVKARQSLQNPKQERARLYKTQFRIAKSLRSTLTRVRKENKATVSTILTLKALLWRISNLAATQSSQSSLNPQQISCLAELDLNLACSVSQPQSQTPPHLKKLLPQHSWATAAAWIITHREVTCVSSHQCWRFVPSFHLLMGLSLSKITPQLTATRVVKWLRLLNRS